MTLHVETVHPENGESPFLVKHDEANTLSQNSPRPSPGGRSDSDGLSDYVECMCGEFCFLADLDIHLDMHNAEGFNFEEVQINNTESHTQYPFSKHLNMSSTAVHGHPVATSSENSASKADIRVKTSFKNDMSLIKVPPMQKPVSSRKRHAGSRESVDSPREGESTTQASQTGRLGVSGPRYRD